MSDANTGPAWTKLGGLLAGVAALLTALVTAAAFLVDVWQERRSESVVALETTDGGSSTPERPVETPDAPVDGAPPSVRTVDDPEAERLALYPGDGCWYPVAARIEGDERLWWPFATPRPVDPAAVAAAGPPSGRLSPGQEVLVPAPVANEALRSDAYIPAQAEDQRGDDAHVVFDQDAPCTAPRRLLVLPVEQVRVRAR